MTARLPVLLWTVLIALCLGLGPVAEGLAGNFTQRGSGSSGTQTPGSTVTPGGQRATQQDAARAAAEQRLREREAATAAGAQQQAGAQAPAAKSTKIARKTPVKQGVKSSVAAQAAPAKQVGSYTVSFASGKRYHGKGSRQRAEQSARRVTQETGDQHTTTEWASAANHREAFKAEALRLRLDGGAKNDNNYNKRESPGLKLLEQDEKNASP